MKMLPTITLAVTLTAAGFCYAEENLPTIDLKTGKCDSVQIEISPNEKPLLRVFISGDQLLEARKIMDDNYEKQIRFKINGVLAWEPYNHMRPPFNDCCILASFPNLNSAVKAAEELIPQK